MMWPFKRKEPEKETRSSATGYTAQIMQARAAYIARTDGLAELTGTVQGCVSLSEGGFRKSGSLIGLCCIVITPLGRESYGSPPENQSLSCSIHVAWSCRAARGNRGNTRE